MTLQIRMLGGFEVLAEPGGPVEIPGRKARALLALLARRPGRPLEREALAVRLWPDSGPAQARASLRQALKQLRRALGAEAAAVCSEGGAVFLDPATKTDLAELEKMGAGIETGESPDQYFLGDFLDGFAPPTEAVEEWIGFERSMLRETALNALSRLAEPPGPDREKTGEAIRTALRLLALDPLQEPVHRLLMKLYLSQGRRGDAAAQYRLCCDILARELDVGPEPETEALFASLVDDGTCEAKTIEHPAVSVEPFRILGGTTDLDHFSEGLAEDLIEALIRWRCFPVLAAGAPDARYRLEGSIRQRGSHARVTARLTDRAAGKQLWAKHFDCALDEIFSVQDEITLKIAATVAPGLSRAELERTRAKRPADLGAWDCTLRGMARMREKTLAGNAAARTLFRRAVEIQPDYAMAYAGLAMTYNINILLGGERNPVAAAKRALDAARQAVALDPELAIAHQELSTAYQWMNRPEEALAEIRIAVELNPYDAAGLHQLGNKSDLAGDPRGIGYMKQAQRLNPYEMRVAPRLCFLARACFNAGDFENAAETGKCAVAERNNYPPAHYISALALGALGRHREGRAALMRCEALEQGFLVRRRGWAPYRDPASNRRLRTALAQLEEG